MNARFTGKDTSVFFFILYLYHLEEHLAHSKYLINISRINDLVSVFS